MPRTKQTNREIEIKLPVTDISRFTRALLDLGATLKGRVFEHNILFDTPDADFRRRGRLLRLRIEKPAPRGKLRGGRFRALLTSKAPLPKLSQGVSKPKRSSRFKEKLEREVAIRNPQRWRSALGSVGFRPGFRYEKFRTTFDFPGLHAELDETPVGTFLELEGHPQSIHRVARALGFSPRQYLRSTYWDLYAADCRNRGRVPSNMLFHA